MKITLTQPTYRSTIWIYIESSDVCTKISTSSIFNPYERLYIWLGQIRDSQLPTSIAIDEEGYGVELIAEKASNEMILFRIDPWMCGNDTATRLATTVKPDELLKAFHDGIAEFVKDGYRPSDWSFTDNLSNINWGALLKLPTIPGQNWQKRLLMTELGAEDGIIGKSELWEQLTLEQQWSIVLRSVLNEIAVMAGKKNKAFEIQALANLYRTLPEDIALGEIDPDWYQERRLALNKEYGLDRYRSPTPEEREHHHILKTTRLKMLRVGQIVDGTVRTIKPYGLFVDIGGHAALLHISGISQMPVEQIERAFKHGDWIRAMIVSLDIERGRVLLSTSDLEVEPGDMLKEPWKVYETAAEMAGRYYQNVLSKQGLD
jgi:predicted RNA-binding protein with RPS1 domain